MRLLYYIYRRIKKILIYYNYLLLRSRIHKPLRIISPIFLVGVQGGGLTIILRQIRRHPQIISVAGTSNSWDGPDEMQMELKGILHDQLRFPCPKIQDNVLIGPDRQNIYASNICRGEMTISTSEGIRIQRSLHFAVSAILKTFSHDDRSRFIDKSQRLSMFLPEVHQVFPDANILVIFRDPRYICLSKAAHVTTNNNRTISKQPLDRRLALRLIAQNWDTTYSRIIENQTDKTIYISYERFCKNPKAVLRRIFEKCNLQALEDKQICSAESRFHLRIRNDSKYPPFVARTYTELLHSADDISIIVSETSDTYRRLKELENYFLPLSSELDQQKNNCDTD